MSSTSRWNAIPPEILQNIPASSACTACASHQLLGVCRSWRRAIRARKQVPPPCRLKITGSIVSLEQAIKVCQMGRPYGSGSSSDHGTGPKARSYSHHLAARK